ncbi:MAG: hypothetical protein GXP59_04470 [Deltaproteobacteria bacterium]|nr:hypothetical protein [Deltaproteobacteria bacterium]
MNAITKILFVFWAVILCGGCSTITEQQASTQVAVKKGAPVVFIHPLNNQAYAQSSVGIMPFALPANMNAGFGAGAAAIFQDILLGKQTFARVKLLSGQYGNANEAITAGRKGKVDLVLAGRINYALTGTEMGGARLDLTVRLINAKTGKTVWHITQAMDQPMSYPQDDMLHSLLNSVTPPTIRRSNGAPAVANMLAQSAEDMADVMAGVMYVRR